MSRHFMPEVLALLREQKYTARPKPDGGYQVKSPPGGNPDYRSFSIIDPQNHHDEIVVMNRLRRAGVKFPDDNPTRSERHMSQAGSPRFPQDATPQAPVSPYAAAREKIGKVVNLLGELEQDVNAIEAKNAKLGQLRELLKGIE